MKTIMTKDSLKSIHTTTGTLEGARRATEGAKWWRLEMLSRLPILKLILKNAAGASQVKNFYSKFVLLMLH